MQAIKRSEFFVDVKTPIKSGMQFNNGKINPQSYKIKTVGYDLVRIYFDSKEKDCTISQERLKRVFTI